MKAHIIQEMSDPNNWHKFLFFVVFFWRPENPKPSKMLLSWLPLHKESMLWDKTKNSQPSFPANQYFNSTKAEGEKL